MPRPVIGICTYLDTVTWGAWVDRAAMVPAGYVGAVQRAGGVAVLLPPDPAAVEEPDPVLDLVDGLILAGGVDVGPGAYGAEPHAATDQCNAERDAFELALASRALERDIPVLGICRGMQVMNVAAGGTLHQHLPDLLGHEEHRRRLGTFGDHDVQLAEGSLAARAAGEHLHATKSHHHQGVDDLGEGFVVTGWSAIDELPEAIERPGLRYALGVQWHPEADETSRLIASLVEEASDARGAV
ncbi:MAG TPA: gamma-glutamyl-gamma-aminobutyrate hydrolase family protein [Solirubrobacteraceae bacterium]|jgi:putative glutamine amidotransferase